MLDFQIGDSSRKIQTWLNQQTRLLAIGLLEKPLRAVEWDLIFGAPDQILFLHLEGYCGYAMTFIYTPSILT